MTGTWPADPRGDMAPILQASVEAAKMRHPSGAGPTGHTLTAADRCDRCAAAAGYMVEKPVNDPSDPYNAKLAATPYLLFCVHHWRKHFPAMVDEGWVVAGGNPEVIGFTP